jgi:hypothetical protein
LTAVTIPDSVTSIGTQAFYRCSGLKTVKIGKSVTSIGDNAFEECSELTVTIERKTLFNIGTPFTLGITEDTTTFFGATNVKIVILPEDILPEDILPEFILFSP